MDDSHLGESVAQPAVPVVEKTQFLAVGNDLGEQQVLEPLLGAGPGQHRLHLGIRDTEGGPQLGVEGTPAHVLAGLVGELLAFAQFIS